MTALRKAGNHTGLLWVLVAILICLSTSRAPRVFRIFTFASALDVAKTIPIEWVRAHPDPPFLQPREVDLSGFTLGPALFLTANYVAIALFGYLLAYPFFARLKVSLLLRCAASFLVGYVCTIPVIRVLSIAVPYDWIYLPGIVFVLGYSGWQLLRRKGFPPLEPLRSPGYGNSRADQCLAVFLFGIVLPTVLLLQIYQVDFHWFGHANVAPFLDEWRDGGLLHFPICTQHYEDLIFHYFLAAPLGGTVSSIIPWWITLGLLKVSAAAMVYALLRKLNIDAWFAIASCVYFLIGTTSIVPDKYHLLFEYANPLYYVAVSGRVLGIATFIMMVVYGACEGEKNRLSVLCMVLLGVGLTAITTPNVFWVSGFYCLAMVFRFRDRAVVEAETGSAGGSTAQLDRAVVIGSVLTSLLLYGLPFDRPWAHMVRFGAVAVLCVLIEQSVVKRIPGFIPEGIVWSKRFRAAARGGIVLLVSVTLGVLFLGNVLVDNPLSRTLYGLVQSIVGSIEFDAVQSSYIQVGGFSLGDFRNELAGSSHNWGLLAFTASYGGILLMVLLSDYLYAKNKDSVKGQDRVLHGVFLVCAGLLPVLLWFTDFVGVMIMNTWVKTRFIEAPVYFIVFYFLYALGRFVLGKARFMVAASLLVYSILPFFATQRHKQIQGNYVYLQTLIDRSNRGTVGDWKVFSRRKPANRTR